MFPPEINDVESAVRSIDIAFHLNQRKNGVVMYDPATGVMLEGSYSTSFHTVSDLVLALAWTATLTIGVYFVLRRRLGVKERVPAVVPSGGIERGWSR